MRNVVFEILYEKLLMSASRYFFFFNNLPFFTVSIDFFWFSKFLGFDEMPLTKTIGKVQIQTQQAIVEFIKYIGSWDYRIVD